MPSIKINQLEAENLKRIRAVRLEPAASGLTIVGGRNEQGKTSVLDAIAWALGGDRYRPSQPAREGSTIPPTLHVKLSNGIIVERKGKNSELKVTDPNGNKSGQQLLNGFVEQLALDLPRFLAASNKDKATTLLRIIGVEEQLRALEQRETDTYNRRRAIGQIADQKKKFAKEQPYFPDAPKELLSASELIRRQQDILARNGENQRKRQQRDTLTQRAQTLDAEITRLTNERRHVAADLVIAEQSAQDIQDESTAELERDIANLEAINCRVRANLDKDKAEEDALDHENQYNALTHELDTIRGAKMDLLQGAALPLPGLSVEDGELTYNGYRWDNLSGSAQLQVAAAIVRKLNPQCGFVLLDKLEQMDAETLREFGAWLENEGLQVIATRVSTGDECSIIIEDGYGLDGPFPATIDAGAAGWKAGVF
jgi:DNA repair exonuclease SbcCD ATPase subunit